MHFLKSILYLISSLAVLISYGKSDLLFSRVDSMYTNMTDLEKVSQLIWTNASTSSFGSNHFGGVYFNQPVTAASLGTNQSIAIQLDERLMPIIDETNNLPDLFTLASLTNAELLSTYYHFLKSYA